MLLHYQCCRHLRMEFHYSKLCLSHRNWRAFTYTPWLPYKWQYQLFYLIYRWILAIYFFGWLITVGLDRGPVFFVYLTFWTFLSFNIYLTWSAIVTTVQYLKIHAYCTSDNGDCDSRASIRTTPDNDTKKPEGCCGAKSNGIKWYHMIQWMLFTIGVEISIFVMIIYWPWKLIFDKITQTSHLLKANNLHVHLFSGLVGLVDLFIVGIPIQILHFIYIQIFGATYTIFTGIYFALNGTTDGETYIYDILDYEEDPGLAVALVLLSVFVALPLIHVILYFVHVARYWLAHYTSRRACWNESYQELQVSASNNGGFV